MVQKTASDVSNRQLQAKFDQSGWVQPAAWWTEHVYSVGRLAQGSSPAKPQRHMPQPANCPRTLRSRACGKKPEYVMRNAATRTAMALT